MQVLFVYLSLNFIIEIIIMILLLNFTQKIFFMHCIEKR